MALTKSIIYKGAEFPNVYAYIARRFENKNKNSEGETIFSGHFEIQTFTDGTKKYRLEEFTYLIPFNDISKENMEWDLFCQIAYPLAKEFSYGVNVETFEKYCPLADWIDLV